MVTGVQGSVSGVRRTACERASQAAELASTASWASSTRGRQGGRRAWRRPPRSSRRLATTYDHDLDTPAGAAVVAQAVAAAIVGRPESREPLFQTRVAGSVAAAASPASATR